MTLLFLRTLFIAFFFGVSAGSLVLLGFFLFRTTLVSLAMLVMGYLIGRRVSHEGQGSVPAKAIAVVVYIISYAILMMTFQVELMFLTGNGDLGVFGFVNVFSFYRFLWPMTPGFFDLSNIMTVTLFLLGGYVAWTTAGKRFT